MCSPARALSTTARISEHAQDNASCCVSMHGVCRRCQHGVSMARPKARNATRAVLAGGGVGWGGRSGARATHAPTTPQPIHNGQAARRPAAPAHPLSALPGCEPPCKRRLRGVGSERRKGRGSQHAQMNADGDVTCVATVGPRTHTFPASGCLRMRLGYCQSCSRKVKEMKVYAHLKQTSKARARLACLLGAKACRG